MDLTTLSDLQIPHKPLAEQIADRINQMIIDQQLQPDDKLPTEVELMAYLDVGRSTIREALKILVARNIVEIRRGKGTFVTRNPGMSKDPLGFAYMQDKLKLAQDLLEVRARIEPWTAYLAAQRANEEDMEKLRAYCAKVVDMDEPYESHHAVDKAFHECIALSSFTLLKSSATSAGRRRCGARRASPISRCATASAPGIPWAPAGQPWIIWR